MDSRRFVGAGAMCNPGSNGRGTESIHLRSLSTTLSEAATCVIPLRSTSRHYRTATPLAHWQRDAPYGTLHEADVVESMELAGGDKFPAAVVAAEEGDLVSSKCIAQCCPPRQVAISIRKRPKIRTDLHHIASLAFGRIQRIRLQEGTGVSMVYANECFSRVEISF
jgi:hypothetical protein